jgi:hypothetical protein
MGLLTITAAGSELINREFQAMDGFEQTPLADQSAPPSPTMLIR